jgi:cell pole-organizing protein PopZ
MSVAVLDPTTPAPPGAPGAVPGVEPCVRDLVADADRSLEAARAVALAGLGDDTLADVTARVARLESRAASLRLALSAEADRRHVAEQTAETGTDAWVARLTGSTREQAASGLRIAGLLQDKYAATREAFAAGDLRADQVRVIVHAAEQAPPEATPEQVAVAEEWLVAKATGVGTRGGRPMDAKRLRQAARRMFACIDHELAGRHEAILLGRESRSAEAETFLALHDNGDGTFSGKFKIPELHGHLLKATLDRLCAPRRLGRDKAGNLVRDESAIGTGWGASISETHGAAWCELIEHLPTLGWEGHGGNGCEVLVKIDLDALLTGLTEHGAAALDTGVAITAGEARRLACNAGLVPAVLDGDSMPLDLGRSRRLHSRTQRRALALTHDTCAIAGCTRPFAWCEIHHSRISWYDGGYTDLDNGLPLCGHHHRRAHDTRFHLHQRPDGEWILRPRR